MHTRSSTPTRGQWCPRFGIAGLALAGLAFAMAASAQTAPAASEKKPTPSKVDAQNKARQTAMAAKAAHAALTPEQMAIAERVYQGRLPCELGNFVNIAPDAKNPGYFDVQVKALKFHMFPVQTSTGAIRLEDQKAGAVWLQLANKSMLMNQKLGQRLADACMSPAQTAVAQALEKNPGVSVLDAAPASPASSPVPTSK